MEGDRKVWFFFDREGRFPADKHGDAFSALVKAGQAPRAAIAASLKRRLKADVTMWPTSSTEFRVQWFDGDVFHESSVKLV